MGDPGGLSLPPLLTAPSTSLEASTSVQQTGNPMNNRCDPCDRNLIALIGLGKTSVSIGDTSDITKGKGTAKNM